MSLKKNLFPLAVTISILFNLLQANCEFQNEVATGISKNCINEQRLSLAAELRLYEQTLPQLLCTNNSKEEFHKAPLKYYLEIYEISPKVLLDSTNLPIEVFAAIVNKPIDFFKNDLDVTIDSLIELKFIDFNVLEDISRLSTPTLHLILSQPLTVLETLRLVKEYVINKAFNLINYLHVTEITKQCGRKCSTELPNVLRIIPGEWIDALGIVIKTFKDNISLDTMNPFNSTTHIITHSAVFLSKIPDTQFKSLEALRDGLGTDKKLYEVTTEAINMINSLVGLRAKYYSRALSYLAGQLNGLAENTIQVVQRMPNEVLNRIRRIPYSLLFYLVSVPLNVAACKVDAIWGRPERALMLVGLGGGCSLGWLGLTLLANYVLLVVCQWAALVLDPCFDSVLENLALTLFTSMGAVKALSMWWFSVRWLKATQALSTVPEVTTASRKYALYIMRGCYTMYSTSCLFFVAAVVGEWLLQDKGHGSWRELQLLPAAMPPFVLPALVFWWQLLLSFYSTYVHVNYDLLTVMIMIWFRSHLEMIKRNVYRMSDLYYLESCHKGRSQSQIKTEDPHQLMVRIHNWHLFLIRYWSAREVDALISPVMGTYLAVSSVTLCACALQLMQPGTTFQLFWKLEYLAATLVQLFFFFWHSNEVLIASEGAAAGAWRCGRGGALLVSGLRTPIVFSAGIYHKMTLATFVAVVRMAYSYYALLQKAKN